MIFVSHNFILCLLIINIVKDDITIASSETRNFKIEMITPRCSNVERPVQFIGELIKVGHFKFGFNGTIVIARNMLPNFIVSNIIHPFIEQKLIIISVYM